METSVCCGELRFRNPTSAFLRPTLAGRGSAALLMFNRVCMSSEYKIPWMVFFCQNDNQTIGLESCDQCAGVPSLWPLKLILARPTNFNFMRGGSYATEAIRITNEWLMLTFLVRRRVHLVLCQRSGRTCPRFGCLVA